MATDLEHHLDGKDAGEDEVEGVEDAVARRLFMYGVFSSQSDAARTDDYHDEQVEVAQVHDEVTETTQPAFHTHTHSQP